jgi:hypothetical protein
MNRKLLAHATLGAASLLAPRDQRAEWLEEWRSELWYIPENGATRFCLGAFRDALWVRRNNESPAANRLESPLHCLAFLAAMATLAILVAICLPAPPLPPGSQLRTADLPAGCVMMLPFSIVVLLVMPVIMGSPSDGHPPLSWPGRLRLGLFLAAKVLLVQPILLFGFIIFMLTGPVVPVAPQLGVCVIWFLPLRWVLLDQRRRCPVCLRLLSDPVRIGSASETFLEWYGAESVCSRGHGFLQTPEPCGSHTGARQWLALDSSWSELFSEGAGRRR